MTSKTNIVLGVVAVGAVLGTLAFFNIRPFHDTLTSLAGAVSTTATANTAKIAEIGFAPANNASSTSILNTDAQDRIIVGSDIWCSSIGTSLTAVTGAGLATWSFNISTSSSLVTLGTTTNTNYIANVQIATTSTEGYAARAIPTTADFQRWPAGTTLQIGTNATNTAQCFVDVQYRQSLGS